MSKRKKGTESDAAVIKPHALHGRDAGAIAGEVAGAILGSAAGPAGAVAGMVLGAVAGSLTGETLEREDARARKHDEDLDETIGVIGGSLGAPRQEPKP